jgi:hypothetical protein
MLNISKCNLWFDIHLTWCIEYSLSANQMLYVTLKDFWLLLFLCSFWPMLLNLCTKFGFIFYIIDNESFCRSSLLADTDEFSEDVGMQCVLQGCLRRKTVLKEGRKPAVSSWQRYWVQLWATYLVYYPPKSFKGQVPVHLWKCSRAMYTLAWLFHFGRDLQVKLKIFILLQ